MRYKKIILLLLIVLQLQEATAERTWLKWDLAEATSNWQSVDHAIAQYFADKTTTLNIGIYVERATTWSLKCAGHMTNVLRNSTKLTFLIGHNTNRRYLYNVFYMDTAKTFGNKIHDLKNNDGHNSGYYVIILERQAGLDVGKILRIAFRHQITNIIVLICASNTKCVVYSYYVFQPGQCRKIRPVVVNSFRNGLFKHPELFPEKFANFHNCPITVLPRIIDIEFLLSASYDQDNRKWTLHGLEAQILKSLAQHLNFSISVQPDCMNDECLTSDVDGNGTATGAFAILKAKSIDLTMGYFSYKRHRAEKFAQSKTYLITPLVGATMNAENPRGKMWIWRPFRYKIWTLICLFFFVGALLTAAFNQFQWTIPRNHITWLDVVGLVIAIPRPIFSTRRWWRYPLLVWSASFFMLIVAYQGQLYVEHNSEDRMPIIGLEDIFLNNYTAMISSINTVRFSPSFQKFKDRLMVFESNATFTLLDALRNSTGKKVVFMPLFAVLQYLHDHQLHGTFSLTEPFFSQILCVYFQPNSYLADPFNKIISRLLNGGLVQKWGYDYFFSKRSKGIAHGMRLKSEPKVLGTETFRELFFALTISHFIAFLTFLGELVYQRWKGKPPRCTKVAKHMQSRVRTLLSKR